MLLRNKKTGIIGELHFEPDKEYHFTVATEDPADVMIYKKLADLYADWEDYEEPKEWWYIDIHGPHKVTNNDEYYQQVKAASKEIGNYFETKEEAEKTVEKLKAWKRLKDKGFKFRGIGQTMYDIDCAEFDIGSEYLRERDLRGSELNKDLVLLFGGEE